MNAEGRDFWSRRKAMVAAEAAAMDEPKPPTEDLSDEEVLAALDLPDPDTLSLGDDFKGFMSQAVPEHLRKRALRRLWRLNPVLANVDGLVDYGDDFTDQATVVENLQTAYQIGKGMMAHVQAMARQAEELVAAADEDESDDASAEAIKVASAPAVVPTGDAPEDTPQPAIRARMKIAYGQNTASVSET